MLDVSAAAVRSVAALGPADVDALRDVVKRPPVRAGIADEIAAHCQRRRRATAVAMTTGCLVGAAAVVVPRIGDTRPVTGPDLSTPTATATFVVSGPLPRPSVPMTLGPRAGASLGGVFAPAVHAARSSDLVRDNRFVLPVSIDDGALRITPSRSDVLPPAPAGLRQRYQASGPARRSVQPVARGYAQVRLQLPGAPQSAAQKQPAWVALGWRQANSCDDGPGAAAAGSFATLIVFTDPARAPLAYRGTGPSCAQVPGPPSIRPASSVDQ